MASVTGTVIVAGTAGEIGKEKLATGYATWSAAIANTETVTFTNFFPKGKFKVKSVEVSSTRLDSNATPTSAFSVGNSDDADGFATAAVQPVVGNSTAQFSVEGVGALITGNTAISNRDLIITCTASATTAVTTGTLFVKALITAE
jgi:hypothetical protein